MNTGLVPILGHDHLPVLCNLLLTNYFDILPYVAGTRGGRSWLKHRATSRKVAGWIPDYVIGIFSLT